MKIFICLLLTLTCIWGQTFKICDERKADKPLPEVDGSYLLKMVYGPYAEAAGLKKDVGFVPTVNHPVLFAAHKAFADHRRLVLSPDIIWLMISQGFATHIRENAEKFRKELVDFTGKKKLVVVRNEFKPGDPDNDWYGVIEEFNLKIKTGKNIEKILIGDFSTTNANALTAYRIAHMDAVSKYYDYEVMTLCGIPEITLEGTTEDWEKILKKVDGMNDFRLQTWVKGLKPILQQFVYASKGHVNEKFWRSIFKIHEKSGGPFVTGWLLNFFPYTAKNKPRKIIQFDKDYNMLNGKMVHYDHTFPRGQANVPFVWNYIGKHISMELKGGFLGVTQNQKDMSVKPNISWVVARKNNEKIIEGRVPKWQRKHLFISKDKVPNYDLYSSVRYVRADVGGDEELKGISKLKALEYLNVAGKSTGAFLEELVDHKNIDYINWSWQIDEKYLPVLRKMKLTNFSFQKAFNSEVLKHLPEPVRLIEFQEMKVKKEYISSLKAMKNLKKLRFLKCEVPDEVIEELRNLNLTELAFHECIIQEKNLNSTLEHLKELLSFTARDCKLQKQLIFRNPLEEVNLEYNGIKSVLFKNQGRLKEVLLSNNKVEKLKLTGKFIRKIDLSENKLFLIELETPALETLLLNRNQLSNLPDVSNAPVKVLYAGNNPLTDGGFPKKFPDSLHTLSLDGVRLSSRVKKMVAAVANLETVFIENSNIGDSDEWMFKDLKLLKQLYLGGNKSLTASSKFWVKKMLNRGVNIYVR